MMVGEFIGAGTGSEGLVHHQDTKSTRERQV